MSERYLHITMCFHGIHKVNFTSFISNKDNGATNFRMDIEPISME